MKKARHFKGRFGRTCSLELNLSEQLRACGLMHLTLNDWQTLPIDGELVPREADIKVPLGDGRKIAVFCDGEAFHGPKVVFGDPASKIAGDRKTALAYFDCGYSAVRYSETEVLNGWALGHLLATIEALSSRCTSVYRNWCPDEEVLR